MAKLLIVSSLLGLAASQSLYGYGSAAAVQGPASGGFKNATVLPSKGGRSVCVRGIVTVDVSTSSNSKFNFTVPANQTGLTDFFTKFATAGSPALQQILAGFQSLNATYNIGATLCTPAGNTKPEAVQLLTHGIGFDRTYWDFAPGYSYVDFATSNGYATLSYDRLGIGASFNTSLDSLNEVQTGTQIAIATALARQLKAGTLSNHTFTRVIGVGHSYGSVISQAITARTPDLLAAAILTGFSTNSTGIAPFVSGLNFQIARENQPYRFSNRNLGYFVSATPISAQIGFFRVPGFDPAVVAQADAGKGTTTYAEWATIQALTAPATNYTGPVAVINGAEDLPFCTGNCTYPRDLTAAVLPSLYPNLPANKTTSYNAADTGHGLNFHYSADAAFAFIHNFLRSQRV